MIRCRTSPCQSEAVNPKSRVDRSCQGTIRDGIAGLGILQGADSVVYGGN